MGVQRKANKRRQYTSEFKREAVLLVTEGGLSMAQVARDLGLDGNLVSRWKKEAAENGQRDLLPQFIPVAVRGLRSGFVPTSRAVSYSRRNAA